jgi:hypothetical protein
MGLPTVISDLEEMGYRMSWGLFSAAEVGFMHQRKRVFILATDPASVGVERVRPVGDKELPALDTETVLGRTFDGPAPCVEWTEVVFAADCRDVYGDGECLECPRCGVDYADCDCPGPTQGDEYAYWETSRRLYAAKLKSFVFGKTNGDSYRNDRLRLLGNGVVPAQAERAFRRLIWTAKSAESAAK